MTPFAFYFAMLEILVTRSWKIPSGQRNEQYTLPKSNVRITRSANASAEPVKIDTRAGVNCVRRNICERGLPPLIFKNPQVIVTKTIVAIEILKILRYFFISFVLLYKNN